MEDHSVRDQQPEGRRRRRLPAGVIAALAAVLFSGSATALWTWQRVTSSDKEPTPVTEVTPTTPATTEPTEPIPSPIAAEQSVQVYWLKDTGTRLEVVPQDLKVQADEQPEAILNAAFEQLLQGPKAAEFASTIPTGTKLLGLQVKDDGVHVDLSQNYTTGGGSASMSGRLAQIIYTASALQPDAPVWLSVEGEPLEVLGGEGLMVDQPMTRAMFEQNFEL
jgi:spore germination protein GerM